MNNSEILKIAQKILNKDIYFAAKVIRMIEEHDPNAQKILEYLYQHKQNAYILGITGLPGSKKSTIVNLLIRYSTIEEYKKFFELFNKEKYLKKGLMKKLILILI